MAMALAIFIAVTTRALAANATISFHYKDLVPEGMDWDDHRDRFLIGSTGRSVIVALSDTGKLDLFVQDPDFSGKAILGVKIDQSRNRVLAVARNFDKSTPAFNAVASYDLDSSARNFLVRLDAVGSSPDQTVAANDVAVDRAGNLYITNSAQNYLWKVTPDGKNASVFTASEVFTAPPVATTDDHVKPCGLNGIVYHWDDYLLVDQSNTGALFKTNLRGDQVHRVKLPDDQLLVGCDGMELRQDGALIIVSSSKAWLLRSSDHWRSASIADELPLNETKFATSLIVRDGSKPYFLYSFLPQRSSRSDFEIEYVEFPKDESDDPIWLIVVLVVAVVLVFGWRFQMSRFFDDYRKKKQ